MPKHSDKIKVRELRERLHAFLIKPSTFDQGVMAERTKIAEQLLDDAHEIGDKALLEQAVALYDQALEDAYPANFWENFDRLEKRDAAALDRAISFLEADPWFFRSGYIKEDLIRFICRLPISQADALRLQKVVLAAIDLRDRRDFRRYCKLAKRVQSKELRKQVEERIRSSDSGIRRRARWVLSAITHNLTFHIQRGHKQVDLGNYEDAIGNFSRAIALEPGSAHAFFMRGFAYSELEQFDKALDDLTRALVLLGTPYVETRRYEGVFWPGPPTEYEILEQRGYVYLGKNEYKLAAADFSQVIKYNPDPDWFAYCKRGRAYYHEKDYEKAINDLNQSTAIDPNRIEPYYLRAKSYEELGHSQLAVEEFTRAIALGESLIPKPYGLDNLQWIQIYLADSYEERGWLYSDRGQYQLAIEDFSRVVDLRPDEPYGYCKRGEAHYDQKEYEKSLADFIRCILLEPKYVEAQFRLGKAYSKLNQFDKAIDAFTLAIELIATPDLKPDNFEDSPWITSFDDLVAAYHWRGWAYAESRQYNLSIPDFSRVIQLEPEEAYGYCKRGRALYNEDEYEQAISDLDKSILLDSKSSEAHYLRGLSNAQLDRCELAITDFLRVIEIDPKYFGAWANLSRAYFTLQQYQEAFRAASEAESIKPGTAIAACYLGKALFGMGSYEDALKELNRSIEIDPKFWRG
jgi:tetratricopeptide (TPR) repeat protein